MAVTVASTPGESFDAANDLKRVPLMLYRTSSLLVGTFVWLNNAAVSERLREVCVRGYGKWPNGGASPMCESLRHG